ncbi:MAG: hypothetical protein IPH74_15815 [Bacteroidetes bacterium]|nr:hypothetical protein [Bacteroidota bacterium]
MLQIIPNDKNRFAYYWNDITNYYNFLYSDESRVLEIGQGAGDEFGKTERSLKTEWTTLVLVCLKLQKRNHPDISFY